MCAHQLTDKISAVDGKVPIELLPDNINFGSTRFAVSLTPQSTINAPAGDRPPGWTEEDCDPPVLALLANVPERWTGFWGSLFPTSVNNGHVQVQAGLRVAYADSNKVGVSNFLLNPVNVNLTGAADGKQFIYAELDDEGNFLRFGYSITDSTKKVIVAPPFSDYSLPGWGTVSGSHYDTLADTGVTDFFPWEAFDNTDENSWRSSNLPASLICTFNKKQILSGYRIHVNEDQYFPEKWEVLADGVVVDVQSSSDILVNGNGTAIVTLTQTVACYELSVKVIIGGDNDIAKISEFKPILRAEAWYDEPSRTMFDSNDEPIRRVYIGYAVVESGQITDVHSYSLGSETYVPIYEGNPVIEDQYIIEPRPYLEYKGQAQLWSDADQEWFRTDQGPMALSSDYNPLMVSMDENKLGLVVYTQLSITAGSNKDLDRLFDEHASEVVIPARARVRVSKK